MSCINLAYLLSSLVLRLIYNAVCPFMNGCIWLSDSVFVCMCVSLCVYVRVYVCVCVCACLQSCRQETTRKWLKFQWVIEVLWSERVQKKKKGKKWWMMVMSLIITTWGTLSQHGRIKRLHMYNWHYVLCKMKIM